MQNRIVFKAVATLFLLSAFSFSSCAQVFQPNDNSKTALDWPGTYSGTIPCADCPGIQTVVQLFSNNQFRISELFLSRSTKPVISTGKFEWQKDYSRITLKGSKNYQFLVAENQLVRLDSKGQRIEGANAQAYILKKMNEEITEKYWKLSRLNGKAIDRSNIQKEPYIIFKQDTTRVTGYAGCNGFGGTYRILSGNKIHFSNLHATLMACANMELESKYLKALGNAAYYEVANNILILKNGKKQPLAQFEEVDLK